MAAERARYAMTPLRSVIMIPSANFREESQETTALERIL